MNKIRLVLLALFASSAFAAERQVINPDVDGNLVMRVNDNGTVKDAITVTGATGVVQLSDGLKFDDAGGQSTLSDYQEWQGRAFSAGNFTASAGSWTVDAGDIFIDRYKITGKTIQHSVVVVNTDVSATPTILNITIPASKTSPQQGPAVPGYCIDAGVEQRCLCDVSGSNVVRVYKVTGNWTTTAGDNTQVQCNFFYEVN